MKQGTTPTLDFKLDINIDNVTKVIFTFTDELAYKGTSEDDTPSYLLQKNYPDDATFEDDTFKLPLTQEETDLLTNTFYVEAQVICGTAVVKSDIKKVNMPHTLWTTYVDDNESDGQSEVIHLSFSDNVIVEGGGSSNYNDLTNKPRINNIELIGNKTDTDLGLATKTELNAKQNTITGGNGIDVSSDVVSVDNGEYLYFSNGKLTISTNVLGASILRQWLADTSYATQYKPLATREYVDNLMSGAVKRLVVESLPTQNIDINTIYMILKTVPSTNNIYDEYMYINNAWELIGSTEVDLTNYYTKTEVDTALGNKQNALSVSEKLSLSSDTLSTSASQVYNAQTNADGTINTSASMYADIKRYDLIIRNSGYYGDNYFGGEVYRVNRISNGTLVITQITDTFSISGTPPTTATLSDTQYKIGDILFSDNGNIYLCTNKTYSSNTWTYTWRTYGGSGLSYTFTDGLTESSGTVGIDLASGSKLLIDANDKLDVDLSSKQDTIDSTHKLDADLVTDTSATNKFVPTHSSTESGKVLGVDNQGVLQWVSQSGGGSYSGGDGIDITNDTISVDLKSGSKLQFDNGELDVDLSSKEDKTDITTDTSPTTVSLTLADNHEYRYTQDLSSLTLTMPSGDFIASVVFASGSTPTSMTYDSSIKWSGDDVTNGQFVPSADKDYDIMMYYNGLNINGIVRGAE